MSNGPRGRHQIYRQLRKNFRPKADKRTLFCCLSGDESFFQTDIRERAQCIDTPPDVILSFKPRKRKLQKVV
jgi:hypothetical protein